MHWVLVQTWHWMSRTAQLACAPLFLCTGAHTLLCDSTAPGISQPTGHAGLGRALAPLPSGRLSVLSASSVRSQRWLPCLAATHIGTEGGDVLLQGHQDQQCAVDARRRREDRRCGLGHHRRSVMPLTCRCCLSAAALFICADCQPFPSTQLELIHSTPSAL